MTLLKLKRRLNKLLRLLGFKAPAPARPKGKKRTSKKSEAVSASTPPATLG